MMNPVARKREIFSERLADEVILYDKMNQTAHRLSRTAAEIWENSDGTKSIDELARVIAAKLKQPVSREMVLLGLEELKSAGLLESDSGIEAKDHLSRRELGRKLAMAGVSASILPLVASIPAPLPAAARSQTSTTSQQYQQDVTTVWNDIMQDYNKFQNSPTAQADLAAAENSGGQGLIALSQGNTAAANADFNAAATDFDGVLKALGLPPL